MNWSEDELQKKLAANPEVSVKWNTVDVDPRSLRNVDSSSPPPKPTKQNKHIIVSDTVYMDAVGKSRPRVTNSGQHTYMPAAYVKAKDQLMNAIPPVNVATDTPLGINIDVVRAMPKSWSKTKKAEMNGQLCLVKPDLDNIFGFVMDAILNEDSHVAILSGSKHWGEVASLTITVITYG